MTALVRDLVARSTRSLRDQGIVDGLEGRPQASTEREYRDGHGVGHWHRRVRERRDGLRPDPGMPACGSFA